MSAAGSLGLAQDPAIVRMRDSSVRDVVFLYMSWMKCAPERTRYAAMALREQGRLGRLEPAHIDVLAAAVALAPDLLCVGELAKALATFGRRAQTAAPALICQLRGARITLDAEYWAFDGAIWALGYLGGIDAAGFLDKLAAETP